MRLPRPRSCRSRRSTPPSSPSPSARGRRSGSPPAPSSPPPSATAPIPRPASTPPSSPERDAPTRKEPDHMDLNRDELRRELRAIDEDNKAAMPRWYSALRQIVGGGTRLS